jgi:hypothetical protein
VGRVVPSIRIKHGGVEVVVQRFQHRHQPLVVNRLFLRRPASADFYLFGFEDEAAAPVAVDAARAGAAIAMSKRDRPLEHVVLFRRGVRRLDIEQAAQVNDEALRRGEFGGGNAGPAGDEGV